MHCVVIGDGQIHTQQPLWRVSQDERMRRTSPGRRQEGQPEPPGKGSRSGGVGQGGLQGLRELHRQRPIRVGLDFSMPVFQVVGKFQLSRN